MTDMHSKKIKLYVNERLVCSALRYIFLLFPFWGMKSNNDYLYNTKSYKYVYDRDYYELVSQVEYADFILIPHDFWHLKKHYPYVLKEMINEAKSYNKLLLIDASGDISGKINVPGSVVIRINQYRSSLPSNEITVPVPCEDLLETYYADELIIRRKSKKPIIGFVGWASVPSGTQMIRTIMKDLPYRLISILNKKYNAYRKGIFIRKKAVRVFRKSNDVIARFIIRRSYFGCMNSGASDTNENRKEFVNNIINSDYSLIVRGDANASTRLYETLSLGRIPVIIDTECVLPLENLIDYRNFCVFIDHKDMDRAASLLVDFHDSISESRFTDMQREARSAYLQYLRYDAFSKHLAVILRERITINK